MLSRARRKPKKPGVTKEQFLRFVPVRNPLVKWDKYPTGEVFLLVPRGRSRRWNILSRFVNVPPDKKVVFDKVGSHIWELCDGKRTVDDIVGEMVHSYKLARREAEAPLTVHLQKLVKRGYVGLVPKGASGRGDLQL